MFVNRLSTWNHLGLSSVTALAEICYFQANILLTGLICSLSKFKWPNVNTLIGLEGIKNVHMQLNCPLMWLIYFYSKLPAFTSPPQPGGTRLASFWLKLNSDSFEYSCAYKVNPCAPVGLLFSWFGQIIHFHPRLCTYVWACKCLMCISDSGFSLCLCAADVCMQIDTGRFCSYLLSPLMSSAVCGNENCRHSELWPLRPTDILCVLLFLSDALSLSLRFSN